MAAPSNPSRVKRYASVITRWLIVVVVVFTITLWSGKYITENWLPKSYTATATILVNRVNVLETQVSAPELTARALQSTELLLPIVRELHLGEAKSDEAMSDTELVGQLQTEIVTDIESASNLVTINVTNPDPRKSAEIANALVRSVQARRTETFAGPLSPDEAVFVENLRAARKAFQEAAGKELAAEKKAPLDEPAKAQLAIEKVQLSADAANLQVLESSLAVQSLADVPTEPSSPHKLICFALTVGVAGLLSLLAGCFIEVIMLFVRASEGEHT